MPNTFEEIMKALVPEQATVVTKYISDLEAAKDGVISGLQASVDTLQKSKPTEPKVEDILKSASPEVQALFKAMKDTTDSLVADKTEALAKARFEKTKAIPVEETVLKEVLKTASPAVFDILEKAAKAIEATILTAKGQETPGTFAASTPDSFYAKLEKAANDMVAKAEATTFEQAFTKACLADPESFQKYSEGVK